MEVENIKKDEKFPKKRGTIKKKYRSSRSHILTSKRDLKTFKIISSKKKRLNSIKPNLKYRGKSVNNNKTHKKSVKFEDKNFRKISNVKNKRSRRKNSVIFKSKKKVEKISKKEKIKKEIKTPNKKNKFISSKRETNDKKRQKKVLLKKNKDKIKKKKNKKDNFQSLNIYEKSDLIPQEKNFLSNSLKQSSIKNSLKRNSKNQAQSTRQIKIKKIKLQKNPKTSPNKKSISKSDIPHTNQKSIQIPIRENSPISPPPPKLSKPAFPLNPILSSKSIYFRRSQKKMKTFKRNPSINVTNNTRKNNISPFCRIRSKSEKREEFVDKNNSFVNELVESILKKSSDLPDFQKAKSVIKQYGFVKSFVVNTHKGTIRAGNEDRVSILLNFHKKLKNVQVKDLDSFKNCSMFSIFDGHGGTSCCNFLKENLHAKILEDFNLKNGVLETIPKIFTNLDNLYVQTALKKNLKFSGSCSVTAMIIDNTLHIINLGDSRIISSQNRGKKINPLTTDHKPDLPSEFSRIIQSGGELYCMSSNRKTFDTKFYFIKNKSELKKIDNYKKIALNLNFGPWRIRPGGLSVSRTFGDIESKIKQFGGIENTVTAEPEVFKYDLEEFDFIFLASDGVFDSLSNFEVIETIWATIDYYKESEGKKEIGFFEDVLSECVNNVLKRSLINKSEDNVTAIMICFKDLFSI